MGLSGRKVKQRIGNDPRNLSWADDAARFGSNYLSKFGWDASKGLGAGGEGRTSHIKVAQKLDMLGIGAAHQQDPNGLAWKQNKDFESLLKRLNAANGVVEEEQTGTTVDGFVKPRGDVDAEVEADSEEDRKRKKKEKKEKKKKDKEGKEKEKKKRKREGDGEETERKSKKKKRSDDETTPEDDSPSTEPAASKVPSPEPTPSTEQRPARVIPRHRSHRARAIAAKSMGSRNAAAISEILGIAPIPSLSPSTTPSGTQTPQEGKLTSIYDDNDDTPEVDKITISTKSLQDYFKEKMGKLKGLASSVSAASTRPETLETDYDDTPRGGLGSRPKPFTDTDDAPRIGLSKFSALISSSFMAATSLSSAHAPAETEDPGAKGDEPVEAEKADEEEEDEEQRRQRKKEKKALRAQRKKEKEEQRRRKRAE